MVGSSSMTQPTIAVIGAGFSGALLALHLLRRCPPHAHVELIDRDRSFGRGMAYGTSNPSHVLNVPAGRMSAFVDRPTDFLDWLGRQPEEVVPADMRGPGSFASRKLYGDYIHEMLAEQAGKQDRLRLVHGDVVSLDRSGDPLVLHTDEGTRIEADLAVLAIGNFPPAPPQVEDMGFYDDPLYRPDPWAEPALSELDPAAPVLLIGTGLTTVDIVISLLDQGHTGPIHALSRRGLLPRRHAPAAANVLAASGPYPATARGLTRHLREDAERALENGGDWRTVVDALRPFTQDVWQAMPTEERARFLRHPRAWWDVHRHRMAGAVADRIDGALASGQLRIHAGRITGYRPHDMMVDVLVRPRGSAEETAIPAARVVNCAGTFADFARIPHPLVRSLLASGVARPDPLRLGLDVTASGALRNRAGDVSRRLFAVGPVTKSTFWEITAVPDIRRQCETLAQHVAGLVRPPAPR